MTTIAEFNTARPRRCSAGTRRHHRTYLPYRLREQLPGAATVMVTPVFWSDPAEVRPECVFHAVYFTAEGRRIVPRQTVTPRVVSLLQGAFPEADWQQSQIWRADTNQLTQWQPATSDLWGGAA